jgi:hypothetical protein
VAEERERHSEATAVAKKDILKVITPDQALAILRQLLATAPELRGKVRRLALKLIGEVDVEGVAEGVFWDLDSVAVEEVWDRSGRKRDGYVDPGEAAWQVFEEVLTPELESLRQFQQLGLTTQAKLQCMGILKGIYRFEQESDSEFKTWSVDAPGEFFASTYREWRQGATSKQDVADVRRFVKGFCPARASLCK